MWGAFLLSTLQIKGGKLARREVKDRLAQEPDCFTGEYGASLSLGYAVCSFAGQPQQTTVGPVGPSAQLLPLSHQ